jgi:hypothetical protein
MRQLFSGISLFLELTPPFCSFITYLLDIVEDG